MFNCAGQLGVIFILNALLACVDHVGGVVQSVVIDSETGKLSLKEGFHAENVAWANFTDHISHSGQVYFFSFCIDCNRMAAFLFHFTEMAMRIACTTPDGNE